jgi:hypothetical protein
MKFSPRELLPGCLSVYIGSLAYGIFQDISGVLSNLFLDREDQAMDCQTKGFVGSTPWRSNVVIYNGIVPNKLSKILSDKSLPKVIHILG